MSPRYCVRCGTALQGEPRACPACHHVHYLDPKLAACVIFRWERGIFLLRRGIPPGSGRWTFPGGYVDRGETVEAAAVREVREEAGCRVRLSDLLGLYSYPGQTAVIVVYRGEVMGGAPRASSESLEGRSFPEEELPWEELAFPSTAEALRDYLRAQRGEGRTGLSRNLR